MDAQAGNASPGIKSITKIAFNIPTNDGNAESITPKLPRRLRRRLIDCKTQSISTQDIESKLHQANIRRQQFYESLSSKARSNSRSLDRASSLTEQLGQQLEAKLQAADQRRSSIIAQTQNRLARLELLRQDAKNQMQIRYRKELDELGAKVESRVRKAEANRIFLLNACRQRRVARRERVSQSVNKRLIQERKYKECVRAAMHQKRVAAERKQLRLLEEKRLTARATALEVQQNEAERKKLKNQLESRLQRAKILREDYLMKRGRVHSVRDSSEIMEHKELSSKLIRCWRQFVRLKGTTFALAKAFVDLEISRESVKLLPFERLAAVFESGDTIRTVKGLLIRLESHITIRQEIIGSDGAFHMKNIDRLLKHVAVRGKRANPRNASTNPRAGNVGCGRKAVQSTMNLSRYPVRVVLGAYMILGNPDVVSCGMGKNETGLLEAAENFTREFELLVRIILEGPIQSLTSRSQLENCDRLWCLYLYHFVTWKAKDAKFLDDDSVRTAYHRHNKALQDKVMRQHRLPQKKLQKMNGIDVLRSAKPSVLLSPHHLTSSVLAGSSTTTTSACSDSGEGNDVAAHANLYPCGETASSTPASTTEFHRSPEKMVATENEVIVNEFVHGQSNNLVDSVIVNNKDEDSIKSRVRDTMERAFWDSITETLKRDTPDYTWILKLVKEVRDELCELSPSWRQEIDQTIDLDVLSRSTQLGTLDIEYSGKILEFSLVTLQKLSAPAKEEELKATHQKLLNELDEASQAGDGSTASMALLIIRGLRFVLQQIQALKHEISKSRINMLEPLIKGSAGFEYLSNSFANRYGSPTSVRSNLPLVMQWLSGVILESQQEWDEYTDSLSAVKSSDGEYYYPTTLRSGSDVLRVPTLSASDSTSGGIEQPECKGEKLDLVLRLGLLKLVSEVEGLKVERLPETLKLNIVRLRSIQSPLQKMTVICTSTLVLRQFLVNEHAVKSATDMETVISNCAEHLSAALDDVEDVGISEIVEIMNTYPKCEVDSEKSRSRKNTMANVLGRSLSADDAVFTSVSRNVYSSARGIVLSGSGIKGKQVAETSLKRLGAAFLTQQLANAVEGLVSMANITARVHGPWYEQALENI